jgi:hypothetical protein
VVVKCLRVNGILHPDEVQERRLRVLDGSIRVTYQEDAAGDMVLRLMVFRYIIRVGE